MHLDAVQWGDRFLQRAANVSACTIEERRGFDSRDSGQKPKQVFTHNIYICTGQLAALSHSWVQFE